MAEEGKEGGNSEGFVAFGYDFEVDRVPVKPEPEEGGSGIDRDHEEDADDAVKGQLGKRYRAEIKNTLSLLVWVCIVGSMHPHQVEGDDDGDQGACCGDDQAQVVKGYISNDRLLRRANCEVVSILTAHVYV